jgi:hypothetical protein
MSSPAFKRRDQLRALYGFDYPDDLFRFWEFANRLKPLDPLHALADLLHITLVGPFDVFSGRFDRHTPRLSPLLHWRYYLDPPEFFTVFAGAVDRLHYGYYLDDPGEGRGCVASYYASDAFELAVAGDDLFQAARMELEMQCRDGEEYRVEDSDHAADYDAKLESLDSLRTALQAYATAERSEHGDAYFEKYQAAAARNASVVASTPEGMGVVAPPATIRPLSLPDKKLRSLLRKVVDPVEVVKEAKQALQEGFPATALKLGKELWPLGGARRTAYAYELLDAAYKALGREFLREVLRIHRANRDLPSVDILDAELDP